MMNLKIESKDGDVEMMNLNVQGKEQDIIFELAVLLNELSKRGMKTFVSCASHISKTKNIDNFLSAFNYINTERQKNEKR